jgi:hypothetical protein
MESNHLQGHTPLRSTLLSLVIPLLLTAQSASSEINETNPRLLSYLRQDSPLTAIERTLGISRSDVAGAKLLGVERRSPALLYGVPSKDIRRGLLARTFASSDDRFYGMRLERGVARLSGITRRTNPAQLFGVRSGNISSSAFNQLAFGRRVERGIIGYPRSSSKRVNRWFDSNVSSASQLLGPQPWRKAWVFGAATNIQSNRTNGVSRNRALGGRLYGVNVRSPSAILNRGMHGKQGRRLGRQAFGL